MSINKIFRNKEGILIIEILVAVAIISIALLSLLGATVFSLKMSTLARQNEQAKKLSEEALEAVRSFRDGTEWDVDGLGTLLSPSYHPEIIINPPNPPEWDLVSGEETIGIFKRKIVFYGVQRDANDDIIEGGGVNDPDSKRVVVTVSWDSDNKKVEISTLLTNWK